MAISDFTFNFHESQNVYHGKVRDVYTIDELLVMVASDRISAFDHILPKTIPFKGQILNEIAAYFLHETKDICPNWLLGTPDPNVSIGHRCAPFKVEMVIRGYCTGHAWRTYKSGKRVLCGVTLPEGLKENDPFPTPIITPTTKAMEGHDEDISKEEILRKGIVSKEHYTQLEDYTQKLYARGVEMAKKQNLILVDTKYEFGLKDGKIYLIDEIHTPDSSRYFIADTYEELQQKGEKQAQLSKEFVREWLIVNGFQGLIGQKIPTIPASFVEEISARYINLYERLTGKTFVRRDTTNVNETIEKQVKNWLAEHHS